jgi:hypothetical protein
MATPKATLAQTGLITAVPNRQVILGKTQKVYCGFPEVGSASLTGEQTLYSAGFKSTYTIGGTPTTGNYVATLASVAYTYAALSSQTNLEIMTGLIDAINAAQTAIVAVKLSATTFMVVSDTTFTAAATPPSPATLTAGSVTGAATGVVGGTTIALAAATTVAMQAGQYLLFSDRSGNEYLVKLSARAAIGATSLTVEALARAIPAGSATEFPVYVWNLLDSGISRTGDLSEAADYNSGTTKQGVLTGGGASISLSGNFTHWNAGQKTLQQAYNTLTPLVIIRVTDRPTSAYVHGGKTTGLANVTSFTDAAPTAGFVTIDCSATFTGALTELDPA